jgi:hypothetical protein
VLLLHDIQPRTVLMLPKLLSELKRRGFKIVHVVPAGERPVLPEMPVMASAPKEGWPRVIADAPRATTGSASAPAAADSGADAVAGDVPLPPVRPIRHAAIKHTASSRPVIAMHDRHAAQ